MTRYRYKGRSAAGDMREGHIEAASAGAVASQLLNQGITPIDIREQAVKSSGGKDITLFERAVSQDDLIMFSRQMYTLTRAGVSIIRAIAGLADTTKSVRLRRVLKAVVESLESGRTMAESLRQHPEVFPGIYISLIRVGEDSGKLDEVFLQMSRYLELDKQTRQRVKTALRYPSFVTMAIIGAMVVVNVFVIPAFSGVFAGFDMELPLPTRILLGVSAFTLAYGWQLSVGLAVLLVTLLAYLRTESGAYHWDRLKLSLPIVGDIITRATLGRFSRSFSMALKAGVPLIQALNAVSRAADNRYVAARIQSMRGAIERGDSLTRTAAATNLFTPLVLQMLSVGEETGQVDDMLLEVADFYDREVEYDLSQLSAYIEPILIGFIGVMVLVLALGIFMPMWELGAAARG